MISKKSRIRTLGYCEVNADVQVDLDQIMSGVSDDDLTTYCRERGLRIESAPALPALGDDRQVAEDFADDLMAAFQARDLTHFRVLLTRIMPPYPQILIEAETLNTKT